MFFPRLLSRRQVPSELRSRSEKEGNSYRAAFAQKTVRGDNRTDVASHPTAPPLTPVFVVSSLSSAGHHAALPAGAGLRERVAPRLRLGEDLARLRGPWRAGKRARGQVALYKRRRFVPPHGGPKSVALKHSALH